MATSAHSQQGDSGHGKLHPIGFAPCCFQVIAVSEVRAGFARVSFPKWIADANGMLTRWGAARCHHGPQDLPSHPSHKETVHTRLDAVTAFGAVAVRSSCTRTTPCPRPVEGSPPLGNVRRRLLVHCKPWSRLVTSRLEVCV